MIRRKDRRTKVTGNREDNLGSGLRSAIHMVEKSGCGGWWPIPRPQAGMPGGERHTSVGQSSWEEKALDRK